MSICIIITDVLNIKLLLNVNYFLIDHENINNLNMINQILKLKDKTIFLYTGLCDLEILEKRIDIIKKNNSNVIIIHTQIDTEAQYFNLSS